MSSPASVFLPRFIARQQADRAFEQEKEIGKRLDLAIGRLDQTITALETVETAGVLASLALGGGVLLQAARTGGKWAVVKTVAKVAASGAVAHAMGKAVEHGLRAVGASEEAIHGVRLAAEVVTWLLLLRRVAKAGQTGGTSYTEFRRQADTIVQEASAKRGLTPNATAASLKKTDVDIANLSPPASRPVADPAKLARLGNFDWNKYTPIEVQKVGDKLVIMNGMTRVELARRAGIKKLPAYVFED